jgi:hypothetical protein
LFTLRTLLNAIICCSQLDILQRLENEIPVIHRKLEKIFPLALFDVMVYLVIHLPKDFPFGYIVHVAATISTL